MQAARDRKKSYVDLKRKPMEFEVGDKVMLKIVKLNVEAKPYSLVQGLRWNSKRGPKFTWEREDQFMEEIPHAVSPKTAPSSSAV
ncbi:hypothetical protein Tco_1312937 [Tanacetum coccineum]